MTEHTPEDALGTTDRILVERPFLRRLALRLSRRDEDADDLVQETILRAYKARDRFETGTSMRAWLATILRRLFLTAAYTSQRRRTGTDTDLGEPIDTLSETGDTPDAPTTEAAYDRALDRVDDRVRDAFVRLPETYRDPFVLFALDGLTYAEIAGRLRIPIGTVMSRIHRARARLKESALQKTTGEIV
ncbi:MAG: RNA polymerase sigma factor [Planctomycetes bacterium]|nr:RNA polymerase sigma factor [Planctomycetota bacterium]